MSNDDIAHLMDELGTFSAVNATPSSKQAILLALHHAQGQFNVSALTADPMPTGLRRELNVFRRSLRRGKVSGYVSPTHMRDGELAGNLPPWAGLGDLMPSILNDVRDVMRPVAIAAGAISDLEKASRVDSDLLAMLSEFREAYIEPHIVNRGAWTRGDTAAVILFVYAFTRPFDMLYLYFGDALGPGIQRSLTRYKLDEMAEGSDMYAGELIAGLLRAFYHADTSGKRLPR